MTKGKIATAKLTGGGPANSKDESFQQVLDPVFAHLDLKLENLRLRTDQMVNAQHEQVLAQKEVSQEQKQLLHDYKLQLKEIESNLQYLSHKTDLKLREMQNILDKMGGDLELRVQDIHFQCREEIFGLTRRIEAIEKILF